MTLPMADRVDILYIASGTTAGLRIADQSMLDALTSCGVRIACVTSDFRLPFGLRDQLRRSLLATDAYECIELGRVSRRGVRAYRPSAIVYSSTHAALLGAHDSATPVAIRFDTPARLSRRGPGFSVEHRLERRRFAEAKLLLPTGAEVPPEVGELLPSGPQVVPLPIPIERAALEHRRDPIVLTYAAPPGKKGLDLVVRAWEQVAPANRRLVITGTPREEGLRHLARHGLGEPREVEWAGLLSPDQFRALTRRAEIYLAGSRYENYGIAQLEALANGALLVTVPSAGPFAALSMARKLAPETVAPETSGEGLATALRAAVGIDENDRRRYRETAGSLLAAHSEAELITRLQQRVLPVLLG